MLFQVKVVSQADYDAHIAELRAAGNTGLLGTQYGKQDNVSAVGRREHRRVHRPAGTEGTSDDIDTGTAHAAAARRSGGGSAGGSQVARKGNIIVEYLTTTDHKKIGYLYLITSFIYFLIGGVLALIIRAQLAAPGPARRRDAGDLQPDLHDARHDHAADVRDAALRGVRERADAAADRRARRRVPAAQRVRVLAVLLRQPRRRVRVLHPGRRGQLRLDGLLAALERGVLAGPRRHAVGVRPRPLRASARSSARSTSSPRSSRCARPA